MYSLNHEDQYTLQLYHRHILVLKALHIPELEMRMLTHLLMSPRPISRSSLALLMGENRTTLLTHIRKAYQKGFLEGEVEDHRGVTLTPFGQALFRRLISEMLSICRREGGGASRFQPLRVQRSPRSTV